ncbi:hypothetical protein MTO96_042184 [Rhipicephalus appendiculatus]
MHCVMTAEKLAVPSPEIWTGVHPLIGSCLAACGLSGTCIQRSRCGARPRKRYTSLSMLEARSGRDGRRSCDSFRLLGPGKRPGGAICGGSSSTLLLLAGEENMYGCPPRSG